jgi:hypothetical protein
MCTQQSRSVILNFHTIFYTTSNRGRSTKWQLYPDILHTTALRSTKHIRDIKQRPFSLMNDSVSQRKTALLALIFRFVSTRTRLEDTIFLLTISAACISNYMMRPHFKSRIMASSASHLHMFKLSLPFNVIGNVTFALNMLNAQTEH